MEFILSLPSRSITWDWGMETSHLLIRAHTTPLSLFPRARLCLFPRFQEPTPLLEMFLPAASLHQPLPATSLQHSYPQFRLVLLPARWMVSLPTMAQHLTSPSLLPLRSGRRQHLARLPVRYPSLPTQRSIAPRALRQQVQPAL